MKQTIFLERPLGPAPTDLLRPSFPDATGLPDSKNVPRLDFGAVFPRRLIHYGVSILGF